MIEYTKGFKYQLRADFTMMLSFCPEKDIKTYWISFSHNGWLEIRRGYAWDGMSGGVYDTKTSMQGSLVHDALYQLLRHSQLPMSLWPVVDDELEKICRNDKMWGWRASLHRKGLGIGGRGSALPSAIRQVHYAP